LHHSPIAHIPERAARPKFVKALAALPLTAVGKIFKPALVRREIADIVRASAAASGTELAALEVVQDPNRGWLARVSVLDDGAALSSALGAFAFASDITPTTRSN
jgi:fatty-acyl-CoA synthase